ncbi:DUF4097 family beta strand repeat-containing protein [Paenibacillus sp. FSL W7-1287]|uniref:DUF4097 family beta strand repeat-containing protein n=1 Tax=Paenibacillus sp. FSL W7-1287 TaxID=2954538 RepID=UPI0030F631C8
MNKQTLLGLIIIIVGAAILFSNVFDLKFSNDFTKGEEVSHLYDATQINELTIRTSSVNVKLLPTDSNTIQMKLYDSRNKTYDVTKHVTKSEFSNQLELNVNSPRKWYIPFQFKSYTYEITVPTHLIRDLQVDSKSGNIISNSINLDELTLEANSGNITIQKSNSETLSAKVTSGNIKLNDISSHSISATASSGNITAEQLESSSVALKATSGNAKLTSFTAVDVRAEVSSGNLSLEGKTAGLNASSSSGNIHIEIDDLSKESRLESSSGNIRLTFLKQPQSLTVIHQKSSGSSSIGKSGFELITQENRKLEGKFGSGEVPLYVKTSSGNFSLQ